MKKSITTDTVEQTTTEITICDKCGLEADDPRPLYRDYEAEVNHGPKNYTPQLLLEGQSRAFTGGRLPPRHKVLRVPEGAADITLRRPLEPDVELCTDCYDELLGWGN